jgi:hypothetical protein
MLRTVLLNRIPVGDEIFRTCPDRPWGPPSLLYDEYRVFSGAKAAGESNVDASPPSSVAVMKEWSYTSTLPTSTVEIDIRGYHKYCFFLHLRVEEGIGECKSKLAGRFAILFCRHLEKCAKMNFIEYLAL